LKTGVKVASLKVPSLIRVNYNTTIGENMIVYTEKGTNRYNKQLHGGDITLRSFLGFKRGIWVNCTGLAQEGWMTEKL
jgi:hypothetical protein